MDFEALTRWFLTSIPEVIVISAACCLLMVDLFIKKGSRDVIAYLSLATVIGAAAGTFALAGSSQQAYSGMFVVDGFATFFKMVVYLATILSILLSMSFIKVEAIEQGEYYVLLLFALGGMMIMASGADLLSIYLGLELMALSVYVLTGFMRRDRRSNEAAMKYVILGAVSTGILLYGISLVYGLTGTTRLVDIATALSHIDGGDTALVLALVFLISGFAFKVAAFPFHMWAPDVYEGAPTPITAFMSVGPKAAGFAVILRVFLDAFAGASEIWIVVIAVIAVLTLAIGSLVALVQTNIKRMLAYSSIAHAGYALLGLVAGGEDGIASVMLYVFIYAFMNMGIFGAVIVMRKGDFVGENIADYTGLSKVRPGFALLMLISLFSLAGIPPTAGFIAKFYIFVALIQSGNVALAVIAALFSAIAAFFYIRVVMLMYMKEPTGGFDLNLTPAARIALGICGAGTVLIGIFPSWFLDMAQISVF
ncbi:MAG TPA: NADH-quinone oxidoreductase subunit N [Rhodospirillaceae bacterium]|nr:NADH-quinone oxidoreductase subunit N [Rhodospirillaceae bacterium]HJP53498.1 NADH-quinone oxidoreductase subunit N [Rhodospirillales bacterium]